MALRARGEIQDSLRTPQRLTYHRLIEAQRNDMLSFLFHLPFWKNFSGGHNDGIEVVYMRSNTSRHESPVIDDVAGRQFSRYGL